MKITAELIERYLEGDLSQSELNNFEAQLKIDTELQAMVELHSEVDMAVSQTDVIDLRQQLQTIAAKQHASETPVRKLSLRRIAWLAAASVAVLLAVSVVFNQQNNTPGDMFAGNFEVYTGPENVRAASPDVDSDIYIALENYNNNDFASAIVKFEQILDENPDNNMIRLYAANALIETGNVDKAELYLNMIIESQDIFYTEHAQWYLALVSLKKDNLKDAKSILENIVRENTRYSDEASELLKAL